MLSAENAGLGMGASVLTIAARLVTGPACVVASSPSVTLMDGSGATIARGRANPGDGTGVLLPGQPLMWSLAWTSWCLGPPPRPLAAEIGFNPEDPSHLAIPGSFEDGPCRDGPTNVSVYREP